MSLFSGDERKAREKEMKAAGRLPPHQALTLKWPVLHYGSVPQFDPARWDFRVYGLVEQPARWTWREFRMLPPTPSTRDFHPGTRSCPLGHSWHGGDLP